MINIFTTLRHNQHVVKVIFVSTPDIWIGPPGTCVVELMNWILGTFSKTDQSFLQTHKENNQISSDAKVCARIAYKYKCVLYPTVLCNKIIVKQLMIILWTNH